MTKKRTLLSKSKRKKILEDLIMTGECCVSIDAEGNTEVVPVPKDLELQWEHIVSDLTEEQKQQFIDHQVSIINNTPLP